MSWTKAFARQAQSDFQARDYLLANPRLPPCHQLHALQMAFEKLAKAHLIDAGSDPCDVQSSHAYIAKVVPLIVREMLARTPGAGRETWVVYAIRDLCRKIELLSPAVTAGGTAPSNVEYPRRLPSGQIAAPADHDFGLDLLFAKAGVTMLKVARARANELSGIQ